MLELDPQQRDYKINEFLTRGVDEVLPSAEELAQEMRSGRRLTAYMGIDPTAPELHVGHASQLYKLRRLQELGHQVILLLGDFTATIGDPTDKTAARVKLTREDVLANAQTYKEQASKILDFEDPRNPVQLRYNSEWLDKMSFADVLELASEFTVQQMSERSMFSRRLADHKPVYLHEFLYPTMQGWDSVMLDVDIEIGGSDQVFNMMVGRDLVKRHRNKQKFVVAGSLLTDPTGKKIGKTEGNMITLLDPPETVYHKIMLWGDGITPNALELCSTVPMEEIARLSERLASGAEDPVQAKMFLARTVVGELYSPEHAVKAQEEYLLVSQKQEIEDIAEFKVGESTSIIDVLLSTGLATSRNAAKRLLEQRGVRINGVTIDARFLFQDPDSNYELQVGKLSRESLRRIIVN